MRRNGESKMFQEERDDCGVRGSYSVSLPDGRLQQVLYQSLGQEGYKATVSYLAESDRGSHTSPQ